jgi:hypothetical protein
LETLQAFLAVFVGGELTLLAMSRVMGWALAVANAAKPNVPGPRSVTAILVAFFFADGLWVLVILIALALYIRHAWWALWAYAGVAAALAWVAAMSYRAVLKRQAQRSKEDHAA